MSIFFFFYLSTNLTVIQYEIYVPMDRARVMVFNATFNNISVTSRLSVLLVEETGGPGEDHRPIASH